MMKGKEPSNVTPGNRIGVVTREVRARVLNFSRRSNLAVRSTLTMCR
jgi:hypothetical protein